MLLQRNSQFALPIAQKSSTHSRTTSQKCRPSIKSRTGIANRSRYLLSSIRLQTQLTTIQELITFPRIALTPQLKELLYASNGPRETLLPESIPNPSLYELTNATSGGAAADHVHFGHDRHHGGNGHGHGHHNGQSNANGNGSSHHPHSKLRIPIERRYYAAAPLRVSQWPPELHDYNARFTTLLEQIKRRHDPTVTTVAQGVLEWKRQQKAQKIGLDVQSWLDRFYMSRIGIRFLIGQRERSFHRPSSEPS